MHKFAVIGHPLSHSLSAIMHERALKVAGIEGTYETLDTPPENLVERIKFLRTHDYDGFNITIPLKVPTVLFLSQFDRYADLSGSVNTVKILKDKSLYGYNTDIYGFLEAIPPSFREILKGSKVAVAGTGGVARSVAIGLSELGVKKIDFYTRNVLNAHDMVHFLRSKFPYIEFNLNLYSTLNALDDVKMFVNTTPVGMKNYSDNQIIIDEKIISTLPFDSLVYDLVYNPLKTRLVKTARERGKMAITGLDMFVHQGAKAFEIWTGVKPNLDAMKIAVLENLYD